MSFPPSKQLNQEKHHFDKKQDYSSKFNLMKAHGACGKYSCDPMIVRWYNDYDDVLLE